MHTSVSSVSPVSSVSSVSPVHSGNLATNLWFRHSDDTDGGMRAMQGEDCSERVAQGGGAGGGGSLVKLSDCKWRGGNTLSATKYKFNPQVRYTLW